MSAFKHLNPKQLKLFMTPDEIMDTISGSIELSKTTESMDDLLKDKLTESKKKDRGQPSSLYNSIKKHGVQRHVTLQMEPDGSYIMGQGHHRVAAAADIVKKTGRQIFIPVSYDKDWNYSNSSEYRKNYPHNVNPVKFDDQGY